jgi:hypothetical protein
MSKREKGLRHERQAKNIWGAVYGDRWVEGAEGGGFQSPDFFDLYDFMVWTPAGVHWVQVKSNQAEGVVAWSAEAGPMVDCENHAAYMAIKYDRDGWRVVAPCSDGRRRTPCDERDDERVGVNQHTPLSIGEGLEDWLADLDEDGGG